jgi:hypothetical protein
MKVTDFKKTLKEAIREVFQEELKNIILEAMKGDKNSISESRTRVTSNNPLESDVISNLRNNYKNMMDEEEFSFSSQNTHPKYNPRPVDPLNGVLPEGSVDLSQILNFV